MFKVISKQNNSNLIDLASGCDLSDENSSDKKNNVRVSVLEIFDPLLTDRNLNKPIDSSSTTQTGKFFFNLNINISNIYIKVGFYKTLSGIKMFELNP